MPRKLPVPHSRPTWLKAIQARQLLVICLTVSIVTAILIPLAIDMRAITRTIISWNIGAGLYLIVALVVMFRSNPDKMRATAMQYDDGKYAVLALVVLSAVMCLGAIVAVLAVANDMQGGEKVSYIVLAAVSVLTSWAFTHVMFALHYAHDFYSAQIRHEPVGLEFPGTPHPDYIDFLYLACVIGTSGQTADVSFTSKPMRRTGLLHCVLAFFFNTTLLALTINIGAGFF